MYVPNLLQFVPNDYIANNYLKSNFYLKDVLCYRKVEEKITGTMSSNLKFDDSEGKAKNWSLLRHCCFVSCLTMLSTNDFKDGILDLDFAEKLKKGNVNNDGNRVERPFITISSENTQKLLIDLSNQVNDYLKDNNLKGSELFSRAVRYLEEDRRHKFIDYVSHCFQAGLLMLAWVILWPRESSRRIRSYQSKLCITTLTWA